MSTQLKNVKKKLAQSAEIGGVRITWKQNSFRGYQTKNKQNVIAGKAGYSKETRHILGELLKADRNGMWKVEEKPEGWLVQLVTKDFLAPSLPLLVTSPKMAAASAAMILKNLHEKIEEKNKGIVSKRSLQDLKNYYS